MAISIGRRQFISALDSATFDVLRLSFVLPVVLLLAGTGATLPQQAQIPAQDPDTLDPTPPGSLNPAPLPPLDNPNSPKTPAKQLFARKLTPFPGPPRSIGGYANGCLAFASRQKFYRTCDRPLGERGELPRSQSATENKN